MLIDVWYQIDESIWHASVDEHFPAWTPHLTSCSETIENVQWDECVEEKISSNIVTSKRNGKEESAECSCEMIF